MTRATGLKIALGLSVALNVLVLVAVASAFAFGPERPNDRANGPRGGPPEIQALGRAFDEDRRAALRARLREDNVLREGRAQMAQTRRAVADALRADPFEPEALREAFRQQSQVQVQLSQRGMDALVDIVSEMSAADRAALVTAFEDNLRKRRRP